jgi:hypothetical protein
MPSEQDPEDDRPDTEPGEEGERPDIFPTEYRTADDATDVAELADAERTVARHAGTPRQIEGVAEAGKGRRAEERLEGWRRGRR